jgi:hypothetical protein
LLDNLVDRKTIRKFYLYDYAGFDPENGKMLYYNAAGTASNARRIDANKDKNIQVLSCLLTYGITLGVNYKTLTFQLTGMELRKSVQW